MSYDDWKLATPDDGWVGSMPDVECPGCGDVECEGCDGVRHPSLSPAQTVHEVVMRQRLDNLAACLEVSGGLCEAFERGREYGRLSEMYECDFPTSKLQPGRQQSSA